MPFHDPHSGPIFLEGFLKISCCALLSESPQRPMMLTHPITGDVNLSHRIVLVYTMGSLLSPFVTDYF